MIDALPLTPRRTVAFARVPGDFTLHSVAWLTSAATTLILLALAFPFSALASRALYGDVFWMLANGRVMLDRGSLSQADPFTFAPPADQYFNVQWLAHLGFAWVEQLAGLEGIMLLNAFIVTATFGLLLHVAYTRSRNAVAAALGTLLAELTSIWFLQPRAQSLALLALASTLWLLTHRRNRVRTLLGLTVVEVIWTNVHGSFFIGPLVVGLYLAAGLAEAVMAGRWRTLLRDHDLRFLGLGLGVQLLATLANPYGLGLYGYLRNMAADPILRNWINEWSPTSATDGYGIAFFASVAITMLVLGLVAWRVALVDVLILGVFAVLGIMAVRNVPWWGVMIGPVVATYLARVTLSPRVARLARLVVPARANARGTIIRMLLVLLMVGSSLPWSRQFQPWLPEHQRTLVSSQYPIAAADFLESHQLGSRIYNDHAWGAYIDWRLWPRYQPIVDSAVEAHPTAVWEDIIFITYGHASWEELLDGYAADIMLIQNKPWAPLNQAVSRSPNWQGVYNDPTAIIYVRAGASS